MLARHAESLFWTGATSSAPRTRPGCWTSPTTGCSRPRRPRPSAVAGAARGAAPRPRLRRRRAATVGAEDVTEYLVLDASNPGSIVVGHPRARENARSVRELISTELWEAINTFYLELRARDLRADLDRHRTSSTAWSSAAARPLAGVAAETMPRDDGWRFLMLGWMLERAEMTCRLLDVRYAAGHHGRRTAFHHWLGIAEVGVRRVEAYRKSYRASMDPADVVEFLLLSRTSPAASCSACAGWSRSWAGSAPATVASPARAAARPPAGRPRVRRPPRAPLGPGAPRLPRADADGIRQVAEAVALQYFRNSQEIGLTVLDFHPCSADPSCPRDHALRHPLRVPVRLRRAGA